jgi:hypothetical protein
MTLRIQETESISEKVALLAHYQKYALNFSKRLAQLVIKCRVTGVELKAAGKLPAGAIEFGKLANEIGERVANAIAEAKAGKFDERGLAAPKSKPAKKAEKPAPKPAKKAAKAKALKAPKAKGAKAKAAAAPASDPAPAPEPAAAAAALRIKGDRRASLRVAAQLAARKANK